MKLELGLMEQIMSSIICCEKYKLLLNQKIVDNIVNKNVLIDIVSRNIDTTDCNLCKKLMRLNKVNV